MLCASKCLVAKANIFKLLALSSLLFTFGTNNTHNTIQQVLHWSIMAKHALSLSLVVFVLLQALHLSSSQSYIGINYGQLADNLPPPSATAKLLQSTSFQKVRLYGTDPGIIKALAKTNIGIVIGATNGDIPGLASDPNTAKTWVNTNVVPYYPASNIILIAVGNEVLLSGDMNLMTQLAPAMKNVQNALGEAGIGVDKIKVSTVHAMAVLAQSDPPSAGSFNPSYGDVMTNVLQFLNSTGSPFAINPYPYFAYQSDPRPDTLAFCLFQPNAGRVDSGNNIKYMNMFDAQVDAVHSALDKMGFNGIEIVVAETGWPYKGDDNEIGPSVENAKAYNCNLVKHLKSMAGTPLKPGKSVDTYLFALYDEDLKPGPSSERSFGLFKPDLSMTYDIGLAKTSSDAQAPTNDASPPTMGDVTPTSSPLSLAPTTSIPRIATPTATPLATSPIMAVDPTTVGKGFTGGSSPTRALSHSPSNNAISLKKQVAGGCIFVAFIYIMMLM